MAGPPTGSMGDHVGNVTNNHKREEGGNREGLEAPPPLPSTFEKDKGAVRQRSRGADLHVSPLLNLHGTGPGGCTTSGAPESQHSKRDPLPLCANHKQDPRKAICLATRVRGHSWQFPCHIDSGNLAFDLISYKLFKKLNGSNNDPKHRNRYFIVPSELKAVLPDGSGMGVLGQLDRPIWLHFGGLTTSIKIHPQVLAHTPVSMNLGLATMAKNDITILPSSSKKNHLQLRGERVPLLTPGGWSKGADAPTVGCSCTWCAEQHPGLTGGLLQLLHVEANTPVIDTTHQLSRTPSYLAAQLSRPTQFYTLPAGSVTLVEIKVHSPKVLVVTFEPSPCKGKDYLVMPRAL